MAQNIGRLGSEVASSWHEAKLQFASDVQEALSSADQELVEVGLYAKTHPNDPKARQMLADALHKEARHIQGLGRLPTDIQNTIFGGSIVGPVAGHVLGEPAATITGPAIEAATGGRYTADPEVQGTLIAMAIPYLGEANESRAAELFAKKNDVSVASARRILDAAREAQHRTATGTSQKAYLQQQKAREGAARQLIGRVPQLGQGKLESEAALKAARDRRASGAGEPTLLDVMERPAQRVVRAAVSGIGDADTRAEKYRTQTQHDITERAQQRTEQESSREGAPDDRYEALKKERDELADVKYRGPYSQPIQTDDDFFQILDFPEGPGAIRAATLDAQRRMRTSKEAANQYHELRSINQYYNDLSRYQHDHAEWRQKGGGYFKRKPPQNVLDAVRDAKTPEEKAFLEKGLKEDYGWTELPEPQPPEKPTLSGGAIDRIYRNIRDKAGKVKRAGNPTTAGGIEDRLNQLGAYLDNIPHLKEARAEYADYSKRMELTQFKENLSMHPDKFARYMKGLKPEQIEELKHAVITELAERMGRSSRAMQSAEYIMTTGTNERENLRLLLGPEKADEYLHAIDLIGQTMDKANYVASGVGSQGTQRAQDLQMTGARVAVAAVLGRTHSMIWEIGNFINRWFDHIPRESNNVIAEWAFNRVDENGRKIPVEETLQEILDATREDLSTVPGKRIRLPIMKKPGAQIPPAIMAIFAGAQQRQTPASSQDQDTDDAALQAGAPPTEKPAPTGPVDSTGFDASKLFGAPTVAGQPATTPEATPASYANAPAEIQPLLKEVVGLENSGDEAVSPKGAIGKFQIWPPTAERYGLDVSRLYDPAYNEQAAQLILTDLYQKFNGDRGAILVAYNGGEGRAREWLASGRDPRVLKYETRKYLYRAGLLDISQVGEPEAPGGLDDADEGELSLPLVPDFGG
jgi:hypothetical protein